MGVVDLHDVGAGLDDQLGLAPQDGRHGLGEGAGGPVGFDGQVLVPHALGQEGRRRQGDLDQAVGQRAQVVDLGGDHPLVPDGHLLQ